MAVSFGVGAFEFIGARLIKRVCVCVRARAHICVINLGGSVSIRVQAKLMESNAKKPVCVSEPLSLCVLLSV